MPTDNKQTLAEQYGFGSSICEMCKNLFFSPMPDGKGNRHWCKTTKHKEYNPLTGNDWSVYSHCDSLNVDGHCDKFQPKAK